MTEHEQPRRHLFTRDRLILLGLVVVAVLGAVLLYAALGLGKTADDRTAERDGIAAPAVSNADKTLALCGGSAGKDVAKALRDAGLCSTAAEVKQRASQAGVPTTVTVQGSVDPRQLQAFTEAAVDSYCGARNECTPDTAVLVPLVANWLRAHPPTQPKPTTAEVRAAVQFVMSQNPAAFKGDPGQDGKDAPPVTDEQVAAAVAAYCSDGRCDGKVGPQGVGLVTIDFRRDDSGVCRSYATLVDPRDGSTREVAGEPVNDLVCQPVPPTTTTTTTTEPPAGGDGGLLGGR